MKRVQKEIVDVVWRAAVDERVFCELGPHVPVLSMTIFSQDDALTMYNIGSINSALKRRHRAAVKTGTYKGLVPALEYCEGVVCMVMLFNHKDI
jgi:hypothetical protein